MIGENPPRVLFNNYLLTIHNVDAFESYGVGDAFATIESLISNARHTIVFILVGHCGGDGDRARIFSSSRCHLCLLGL